MYGYIYKTTDLKTGKIYVGQHKASTLDSLYFGSGTIITNIIKKCKDNNELVDNRLHVELLESCESREQLDEKEAYWIDVLDTKNPNVGYNLRDGGNGANFSDDTRQKMSAATKRMWEDPEYRAKTTLSMSVNKKGKPTNMKDYVTTPELRQKRSVNASESSWYNNGVEEKFLKTAPEGFWPGRLPVREEARQIHSRQSTNSRWVHDGTSEHFVPLDKVEAYLSQGYTRGRLRRKHRHDELAKETSPASKDISSV